MIIKSHREIGTHDVCLGIVGEAERFSGYAKEKLPAGVSLYIVDQSATVYASGTKRDKAAAAYFADGWKSALAP